jgi:hypothetical protein
VIKRRGKEEEKWMRMEGMKKISRMYLALKYIHGTEDLLK